MSEPNGEQESGSEPLDRIERALNLMLDDHILFRDEHKLLLSAQVVMQGGLGELRKRHEMLTAAVEANSRDIGALANGLDTLTGRVDTLTGDIASLTANVQAMRWNFDERLKRIEQ